MLVVYKVTAALLSLTLVSVIIYESLYGRDLNDEGLKLRRRSFAAFYFLYLISTAFRYFSISDHGIELIPIRVMSMDIITFVVAALLIAAYFGRWYYKHFYSWFFSLLLPVLILSLPMSFITRPITILYIHTMRSFLSLLYLKYVWSK